MNRPARPASHRTDPNKTTQRLRLWRRRLLVIYIAWVLAFASSCAMAASGMSRESVLAGLVVSAVMALPLYAINLIVHHLARKWHSYAGTVGLRQLALSLLFLTPIEAALVLPAINLVVTARMLRQARHQIVKHEPP